MNENSHTEISDLHKSENGKDTADQAWQDNQAEAQIMDNTKVIQEIEDVKSKYLELDDQYKRLWADHQNMMNRFNRERSELYKYAAFSTLESLLPALDNFDFAKKSINENTAYPEFIKSLEMLQEQILMSLKSIGLTEVETNVPYNPEWHEAISKVQVLDKAEGTIIQVLKKVFKLNDKVLRVATVVVSTKE
jgi:molecular chaperone GrpE